MRGYPYSCLWGQASRRGGLVGVAGISQGRGLVHWRGRGALGQQQQQPCGVSRSSISISVSSSCVPVAATALQQRQQQQQQQQQQRFVMQCQLGSHQLIDSANSSGSRLWHCQQQSIEGGARPQAATSQQQ